MKKISLMILIGICFSFLAVAQSVKVISPNGGESWQAGTVHAITWTALAIPNTVKVRLTLFKNGHKVEVIAANLDAGAGGSHYDWTVGQYIGGSVEPGGGYKIYINAGSVAEDFSDAPFTIASGPQVVIIGRKHPELPPVLLKFPRLEVSNIDLAPNLDGFGIIFSYKNAGNGPLAKASEVPVKPSYRVLVDGKETAKGFLFLPAFPAPPGWEQAGYFGGWIVLPTVVSAEYSNWYIGGSITVHINENKAMGMESHSLTLPLKPIALKYKCDALINGVSFNWQTHMVTVSFRYEGQLQPMRRVSITCSDKDVVFVNPDFDFNFFQTVMLTEGQHYYSFSKKINFPEYEHSIILYVKAYVPLAGSEQVNKVVDMDYRNNFWKQCKFVYPDSNPVR